MTTDPSKGSRRSFPRHRETILDILRESQKIASFPLHSTIQVGEVAIARCAAPIRISWTTLFGKAYALVCRDIPELRDIFVSYPRPYLYRHPHTVASMSVHRKDDFGIERLIFGRWVRPEASSLIQLQQSMDAFVTAPIQEVYREVLTLEKNWRIVRRLVWHCMMNWAGRKRAKHVGTFSISTLGGQGVLNAHHPLITTSSLAIGPFNSSYECEVVLICDHRTIDGWIGAQALNRLQSVLQGEVLDELNALSSKRRVA